MRLIAGRAENNLLQHGASIGAPALPEICEQIKASSRHLGKCYMEKPAKSASAVTAAVYVGRRRAAFVAPWRAACHGINTAATTAGAISGGDTPPCAGGGLLRRDGAAALPGGRRFALIVEVRCRPDAASFYLLLLRGGDVA